MSRPTKRKLRNQARAVKSALQALESANPGVDFSPLHAELLKADWLAGDRLFSDNETALSDHVFPGEVVAESGGAKPRPPN
jgi:hypothetical protein